MKTILEAEEITAYINATGERGPQGELGPQGERGPSGAVNFVFLDTRELPEQPYEGKEDWIYLIPKENPTEDDHYDGYYWVSQEERWEHWGGSTIALDDYLLKEEAEETYLKKYAGDDFEDSQIILDSTEAIFTTDTPVGSATVKTSNDGNIYLMTTTEGGKVFYSNSQIVEDGDELCRIKDLPTPDTFCAVYNESTFTEVNNALTTGKLVYLNQDGAIWTAIKNSDTEIRFYRTIYNGSFCVTSYYRLYSTTGWASVVNIVSENRNNKVTALSASSTDVLYPSAKCVYDLIKALENRVAALEG